MSVLTPESFKPCGVGGGVADGVLNVAVAEVVLNQPRVGSLVGKRIAAGMAQHVRVGEPLWPVPCHFAVGPVACGTGTRPAVGGPAMAPQT